MKNIYIIKQQNGTYTAFSTYYGVSMGATIHNRPDLKKEEVEIIMRNRISTQMVDSKRKNNVVVDEIRRRWSYVWLNEDEAIRRLTCQQELCLEQKGKPKIYEVITDSDGNPKVVSREHDLLDEDEMKLEILRRLSNDK